MLLGAAFGSGGVAVQVSEAVLDGCVVAVVVVGVEAVHSVHAVSVSRVLSAEPLTVLLVWYRKGHSLGTSWLRSLFKLQRK